MNTPTNSEALPLTNCSALFAKMESLAKGWEEEGKYLNNPWDDPSDRAAGRAYAECAETLRGLIKHGDIEELADRIQKLMDKCEQKADSMSDIEELTERIQKLMDKCEQKAEAYVNGH
jgi:hypothetical protein